MILHSKTSDSKKYKTLVLTTLDYLIDRHAGEFVYDGFDPVKYHYEEQKVQAEKYLEQRRRTKLRQQLERLTEGLRQRTDLEFTNYIRERTGYDLDIFAELKAFGEKILSSGVIQDEIQSGKLNQLIRLYDAQNEDDKQERLKKILSDYDEKSADHRRLNQGRTRVVKTEEKDGIITETVEISFGPKRKHSERREVISPDGLRKLLIQEYTHKDEKDAVTSVSISFKTSSGGIYAVKGIHPDINAFWKSNNTVVIETSGRYSELVRHRQIQSFQDIVNVEYTECD